MVSATCGADRERASDQRFLYPTARMTSGPFPIHRGADAGRIVAFSDENRFVAIVRETTRTIHTLTLPNPTSISAGPGNGWLVRSMGRDTEIRLHVRVVEKSAFPQWLSHERRDDLRFLAHRLRGQRMNRRASAALASAPISSRRGTTSRAAEAASA